MAFKFIVFASLLAFANAGLLGAPAAVAYGQPSAIAYGHPSVAIAAPSLTSQQSNIIRSYGNLGQIATQSKTINTPYSSVSKSDVRVSNPGYVSAAYAAPAPLAYHQPAPIAYAPRLAPAPAPLAYAGHGLAAPAGLLGVAYSAAPAVSHMTYSAPALGLSYGW